MENTPSTGVVQNEFDRIGGNYAPENSDVSSQNYLTGLTPPSSEQLNDKIPNDSQEPLDWWSGSFELEDGFLEDYSLYQQTGDPEDLWAAAPKCPVDYVEPPPAKRQRFSSNSATGSSSSMPTTQQSASPITDSLNAFSSQVMPTLKVTEPSTPALSVTTPKPTSEVAQEATGQESPISQVSLAGMINPSNSEHPITRSNDQGTGFQTRSDLNQISQSSTNTVITPENSQTPLATQSMTLPEGVQTVTLEPSETTGIAKGPMLQMHIESNAYGTQVSPQKTPSPRRSVSDSLPLKTSDFTSFKRSTNKQSKSYSQGLATTPPRSTELATSFCLPTFPTRPIQPTCSIIPRQAPTQALERNTIQPQLRDVMEKFEAKIQRDDDLRQAFNIVFPGEFNYTQSIVARSLTSIIGRITEVETLKQMILNERHQAAIRENALKDEIRWYQENATTQEALQTRAMDVLTHLRANPSTDRSWVCLNYNKDTGGRCNHIHKEFYLSNKLWKRRERCQKCKSKVHEKSRKYFDDDAEISAWLHINDPPADPETQPLKRTRDMMESSTHTQLYFVDPSRRQSLPDIAASGQGLQQTATSRWTSLPPPTKKYRNHTPLSNSKDTQATLRAVLGTSSRSWMQPPKPIETIVLDDDSDEEDDTDQSQESSDDTQQSSTDSPAVAPENYVDGPMNNGFDAEFEVDFDAEFDAEFNAQFVDQLAAARV